MQCTWSVLHPGVQCILVYVKAAEIWRARSPATSIDVLQHSSRCAALVCLPAGDSPVCYALTGCIEIARQADLSLQRAAVPPDSSRQRD